MWVLTLAIIDSEVESTLQRCHEGDEVVNLRPGQPLPDTFLSQGHDQRAFFTLDQVINDVEKSLERV